MCRFGAPPPMKMGAIPPLKGSCEKVKGRDALPRVRNWKTKPEAEHRVPTR